MPKLKTITVTNQKGGVAKTTTSVNLSACLAANKFKVLLIDLDPQGQAGEHLGLGENNPNILDVLTKKSKALEAMQPTYIENLFVLNSNIQLGSFNQQGAGGNQFSLKEALVEVQDEFDFVIIDCQPSLSLLTLNALTAADYVILPVQSEFFALDGLTQLILTLKEIQNSLNPDLKVLGILLTMFDKRNRLSMEVKNELFKNFENELFHTIIPRNVKLAEAPSFGKAIIDYEPNSLGAEAYRNLAKEVLKKVK